jgi:hypothetical protein
MSEITTAARRIAADVNKEYGKYYELYYDAEGNFVAARVGPEEFGPSGADYAYGIRPTLMGPQPVHWTQRMVQDAMDEQNEERGSNA